MTFGHELAEIREADVHDGISVSAWCTCGYGTRPEVSDGTSEDHMYAREDSLWALGQHVDQAQAAEREAGR